VGKWWWLTSVGKSFGGLGSCDFQKILGCLNLEGVLIFKWTSVASDDFFRALDFSNSWKSPWLKLETISSRCDSGLTVLSCKWNFAMMVFREADGCCWHRLIESLLVHLCWECWELVQTKVYLMWPIYKVLKMGATFIAIYCVGRGGDTASDTSSHWVTIDRTSLCLHSIIVHQCMSVVKVHQVFSSIWH